MRRQSGFALIDVIFVCGIIGILSTIALPRLLMARQYAGAAAAIGSLRAIASAQLTYALTCGGGFYAPNLVTLGTPPVGSPEAFIGPNLSGANAVTKSGYIIQVRSTPLAGAPPSCNGIAAGQDSQAYKAAADAIDADNIRFFAINADAQIWEHSSSLLTAIPENGEPAIGHVLR